MRFNQLLDATGETSTKKLTGGLKSLGLKRMVIRWVEPGPPTESWYRLTTQKPPEITRASTGTESAKIAMSGPYPHIEVNIRNEGSKVSFYDKHIVEESQRTNPQVVQPPKPEQAEPQKKAGFETPSEAEPEEPLVLLTAEDAEQRAREWITSRHGDVFKIRFRKVDLSYGNWWVDVNFDLRPYLIKAEHKTASIMINGATGAVMSADEHEDYYAD